MSASPIRGAPDCRLRLVPFDELNRGDIEAWAALEANAVEPNAYLSPHFVMPALKWLEPDPQAWRIAILERGHSRGREIRALGVVRRAGPSRQFPAPHFVAHRSVHSFLGGLLIHKDQPGATVADLLEGFRRVYGHGLVIPYCRSDGPFASALAGAAAERGWHHRELGGFSRAILRPKGELEHWADQPPRRLKEFRRKVRKFGETGPVRLVVHRRDGIPADVIDRHLALEHTGWKGRGGTSLRSQRTHEAFFRDVVAGFGSVDRALFAELWIDDRVVASTSNWVAGDSGFTFKIGWDPAFAKLSPMIVAEFLFVQDAPTLVPDLVRIDSGAEEGSYIDQLWHDRERIALLVIATSAVGRIAAAAAAALRALRRGRRN